MVCIAQGLQVNLSYPGDRLGSRRERMGKASNTPPPSFCLSLPWRTRETSCWMLRGVGS